MSHYGALDGGDASNDQQKSQDNLNMKSVVVDACCDGDDCSKSVDASSSEPNGGIMCSLSWVGFALIMAWFSVIWNTGEGVAGVYIGAAHMQLSVLANAGQSGCEVVSAILVLIRLREEYGVFDRPRLSQADLVARERIGIRWMGILFCSLAVSVLAGCIYRFYSKEGPEDTLPGMIVSAIAGFAMIILYYGKRAASRRLNSKTLMEDANCSMYCFKLSVSVVIGSLLGYYHSDISDRCHVGFCDLWWVDATLAAVLSLLIFRDGVKSIRVSCDENFDGGCGCCAGDKPASKSDALLGGSDIENTSCCSGGKSSDCCTSTSNCGPASTASCFVSIPTQTVSACGGNKASSCCSTSSRVEKGACGSKPSGCGESTQSDCSSVAKNNASCCSTSTENGYASSAEPVVPAQKSCCASGQKCCDSLPVAHEDVDSDPDIYADD